jgi:hypothetical protein
MDQPPQQQTKKAEHFAVNIQGTLKSFEGLRDGELELAIQVKRSKAGARRKVFLVLVVDRSGSMSGTFERQVVPALNFIIGRCYEANIEIRVILYESTAVHLQFNKSTYQNVVSKLKAGKQIDFLLFVVWFVNYVTNKQTNTHILRRSHFFLQVEEPTLTTLLISLVNYSKRISSIR